MNQLNPQLKELLRIARKAELASLEECEAPAFFTGRVLAELREKGSSGQYSLLERMVKRGAVFAGIVGLITLTAQFSTGRPLGGIWEEVPVPGAVLLRIVLR